MDRDGFQGHRGRARGRGQGRGRGKHPSGLSGKEIGLWYAAKGRAKKREREVREVCTLNVGFFPLRKIFYLCLKYLIEFS